MFFPFLGVAIGLFNMFLLAVVIYVIKQPDPHVTRELSEFETIKGQIEELIKHVSRIEKRLENAVMESKRENISKLETLNKDMNKKLQVIQDNL